MPKKTPQEKIIIEKIVAGGMGLGRTVDGMVAMVRHVLPGEEVTIQVREQKKNYLLADLVEVLKKSQERVTPLCPVYTRCGGCDFQHISLTAQHKYKSLVFAETIRRGGEVTKNLDDAVFLKLQASPEPFGYRQRIRLHVDDRGRLGFHRFQSHEVERIENCPLARSEINEALEQMRSSAAIPLLLRNTSTLELLWNPDGNGEVIGLFHFTRRPRPADLSHGEILQQDAGIGRIFYIIEGQGIFDIKGCRAKNDDLLLSSTLPQRDNGPIQTLTWEAGGFCQVNQAQNENLIRIVLNWAQEQKELSEVLDLFCGMGNFSIPLSRIAESVYGIDGQGAAIRSAQRNAILTGKTNCTFTKKPVGNAVQELIAEGRTFPLILIDPPRQGAPDIIQLLPVLKPDRIIIVSCNPATLARDLNGLIKEGFVVNRILPVDMFPQTHHMESVSLLTSSDSM